MPRSARVVLPEIPHHVVQRGNRRQQVFFCEQDYRYYLRLLRRHAPQHLEILAYCLMPNHVHLVVIPRAADALAAVFGKVHHDYTAMVNHREKWTGFLWQGRFYSSPMDESHTLQAACYSENNPVFAGLVTQPEVWRWSSALGHLGLYRDPLISNRLTDAVGNWRAFLAEAMSENTRKSIRQALQGNKPLGSLTFLQQVEKMTGRKFVTKKMLRAT